MEYIKALQNPLLVAKFQNYFGVTKSSKKSSSKHSLHKTHHKIIEDDGNSMQQELNKRKRKTLRSKPGSLWKDVLFGDDTVGGTEGSMEEESTVSESENEDIDFEVTNRFWYNLFFLATKAGDEVFYGVFFPFWVWNIDGAVLRRVVVMWMFTMYIGQALKDLLKIPRPSCPPVIRLDSKWTLEYGLPSTHAMVAFCMPFSVLFFSLNRYQLDWWWGTCIAVAWCSLVCLSRLYLGMHSVLDIMSGLFLVSCLMALLLPLIDIIDHLALTHPISPIISFILTVAMIVCYPATDRWTPARGDTTVIVGVGYGTLLGSWLNYQMGIISEPSLSPPYSIMWPSMNMVGLTILRTCIGLVLIVAVRAIFKSLSFATVCAVLQVNATDYQQKSVSVSSHQRILIELTYKFITYVAIGFTFVYTCPLAFRIMDIERPTFYTEV